MSGVENTTKSVKQEIQEISAKLESNAFTMLEILVRRENMKGANLKVSLIDDDAEDGPTIYFSNASNFYKPIEGKLKFGALTVDEVQHASLEELQKLAEKVAHKLTTRH